jgi:protein-tyrosine phosphatase
MTTPLQSSDAAAAWRPVRALLRRIALPLVRASERERVLHDWRRRRAGEPALPARVRSVAFVCKGNLCRSPFAAALLARARPVLRVTSYGIDCADDRPADPTGRSLVHEYGVDLDAHRTRRLDDDVMREVDLLLVMEAWQARAIERRWPAARDRVRVLGDFLPAPPFEIEDPWGQPEPMWRSAYQRIDASIARLVQRLEGG